MAFYFGIVTVKKKNNKRRNCIDVYRQKKSVVLYKNIWTETKLFALKYYIFLQAVSSELINLRSLKL